MHQIASRASLIQLFEVLAAAAPLGHISPKIKRSTFGESYTRRSDKIVLHVDKSLAVLWGEGKIQRGGTLTLFAAAYVDNDGSLPGI